MVRAARRRRSSRTIDFCLFVCWVICFQSPKETNKVSPKVASILAAYLRNTRLRGIHTIWVRLPQSKLLISKQNIRMFSTQAFAEIITSVETTSSIYLCYHQNGLSHTMFTYHFLLPTFWQARCPIYVRKFYFKQLYKHPARQGMNIKISPLAPRLVERI